MFCLISVFLFSIAFPFIQFSRSRILLLSQLEYFETCNVHIISVNVEFPIRPIFNVDRTVEYQLEIFKFPTTRSTHYFSPLSPNISDFFPESDIYNGAVLCGTFQVKLIQSKSNFVIRLPPSPRQNCVVQVYIGPPACTSRKQFLPPGIYKTEILNVPAS